MRALKYMYLSCDPLLDVCLDCQACLCILPLSLLDIWGYEDVSAYVLLSVDRAYGSPNAQRLAQLYIHLFHICIQFKSSEFADFKHYGIWRVLNTQIECFLQPHRLQKHRIRCSNVYSSVGISFDRQLSASKIASDVLSRYYFILFMKICRHINLDLNGRQTDSEVVENESRIGIFCELGPA
jgi:hypothetical protein